MIRFERITTDGPARRGRFHTAHGSVETPAFMPVGTVGSVKAMHPEAVRDTGAEILLGNVYHLMLRPGAERVAELGGLHQFMNWPHPILTDSGGFQVYSLSKIREINEEGAVFRSHIDGSKHQLSPERSIQIQHLLDSNITMAFDECTPYPVSEEDAATSMRLSMRWAARSREAFVERDGYGIFGIVQGSVFPALREESAKALADIGFHGYAIGGLAVGEGPEMMFEVLDYTAPMLPEDQPRYLMGVGKPPDMVEAVRRGVDMFDCVLPTRSGRNGQAFTRRGAINLSNARHAADPRPLDPDCSCPACSRYTRAYLHHLFRAKEILGPILCTTHNLHYYQELMQGIRGAIEAGEFAAFAEAFYAGYEGGDLPRLEGS